MSQSLLFDEAATAEKASRSLLPTPGEMLVVGAGGDRAFVCESAATPGFYFVCLWLAATDAPRTLRELGRQAVTAIGPTKPVAGPRVREVLLALGPGFGGGEPWTVCEVPSAPWSTNVMLGES